MIFNHISYSLCGSSRSRTAAENSVCDWGQLVCHSVCNVSPVKLKERKHLMLHVHVHEVYMYLSECNDHYVDL